MEQLATHRITSDVSPNEVQDALQKHLLKIHAFNELPQLLDYSLDAVLSVVKADSGSLFMWDDYQKGFMLKAVRGRYRDRLNQAIAAPIRLREGILGWAGEQGHSILVKDVQNDQRLSRFHNAGRYRSSSFIIVPLISNNRLLGMVNVTEKDNLKPFTEADHAASQTLAKHITIAYEKLQQTLRLRHDYEEMQKAMAVLRDEAVKNEPLVSVGKFSMHMAHEITNPLDAIRRYVNMALDHSAEDSVVRDYLVSAKKGIRSAVQILRGLLLLHITRESQQDEGRRVGLSKLIDGTLETLSNDPQASGITIEKKYCERPLFVRDSGVAIVLHNLYTNAIHAMGGKGVIRISTSSESGVAVISVEDTGTGIPEHLRAKVFEPFFTTKKNGEGSGIGLALATEILGKKRGSIDFVNLDGKGTRFVIKLPEDTSAAK